MEIVIWEVVMETITGEVLMETTIWEIGMEMEMVNDIQSKIQILIQSITFNPNAQEFSIFITV